MSEMIGKTQHIDNHMLNSLKSAIFTKNDMEKAFDRLKDEMETTVRQELEMFYRMSGKLYHTLTNCQVFSFRC